MVAIAAFACASGAAETLLACVAESVDTAMSRESLFSRLTACHVVAINTRITRYRLNDAAGSR